MKKIPILFCCLALVGLSWMPGFAQSQKVTANSGDGVKKANQRPVESPTPSGTTAEPDGDAETDDSEVIKVATGVVSIPVKVLDRNGRFIGGLTQGQFKVFEDGIEQPIEYFSNEQEPFTVALVLDMSYSAKFKAEEIQAAALAFINQLRANDRVMIVSFDQEIYVHCEPTSDRRALQAAIGKTKISYGTSVYDAMDLVINQKLRNYAGRKAIVLFSDGVDTTSRNGLEMQNLSDALESDALIYPIQYDTFNEVQAMKNKPVVEQPKIKSPLPSKDKNPLPFPFPGGKDSPVGSVGIADSRGTTAEEYEKADLYLNELAGRTGGRLYKASTITSLSNAFSRIASELREYYSIGYTPKDEAAAGQKHKIKVKVERDGVVVKTRDSYVVGEKQENSKN
ncbi:MAG TPA: VWA domain-containing protein [Pyrinomonadaceae bacterium]|jgi:VWFA-related protein